MSRLMSEPNSKEATKLKRALGLPSVVLFLFGYVVGAGILIQTGAAAGIAGPSLWLAFIIAGIPNLISAVIMCYIVSSFPVSGGAWVYSSRLGGSFVGFIVVASIILHIIGALALLAVGFGTYFEIFIPGSALITGIVIILIFYMINVLGIKLAGWVQAILAICGDFLVLFIFIIFGLPNIKLSNLTGENSGGPFPMGIGGIFVAAVILSFSFAGFAAIIELGGEIKNPKRNIPLGLIISFSLITTVYILVSLIMTGVMNWKDIGNTTGTLVDVAALFLPSWFLVILSVLILVAIASTIHGVLLAYSRDLFSAARDKMLPNFLASINKKYKTPHWALTFFAFGAIIMLLLFQSPDIIINLSFLCSFTITLPGVVLAYIPIKLRKKFPELVEKSNFRIKNKFLTGLIVFNIIYGALAVIAMIIVSPIVVILASIFYTIAIAYYFVRKKWLKKHGFDLTEICKKVPEEALET